MARKGYQEIWSVSRRLSDNLGELAPIALHVETEYHIDFTLNF